MVLIQAAMAGGVYLVVIIGIAFFIGTPILTIIISNYLSKRNEKLDRLNFTSSLTGDNPTTNSNNYFAGCLIAIVIMVVLIFLGIALLDVVVPNID